MRILVGAPTYNGQLTTQYARSLLELWGEIGAQAEWRTTKATLIAWARNVFASQVLEGDYSHLLFVDADIDFPARVVKRMLAFDQPVVSAVYPHRTLDVQAFYAQARRQPDPGAAMVPAGLMPIQRGALERMRVAYPELHRPAAGSNDAFQGLTQVLQCFEALTDENGIAMSEDVSFCRRWRAIGGELWATFDQAVGYTGPFTFRATG